MCVFPINFDHSFKFLSDTWLSSYCFGKCGLFLDTCNKCQQITFNCFSCGSMKSVSHFDVAAVFLLVFLYIYATNNHQKMYTIFQSEREWYTEQNNIERTNILSTHVSIECVTISEELIHQKLQLRMNEWIHLRNLMCCELSNIDQNHCSSIFEYKFTVHFFRTVSTAQQLKSTLDLYKWIKISYKIDKNVRIFVVINSGG